MKHEPKDKPFPWQCVKCLKPQVWPTEVPYTGQVKHDGRLHDVRVSRLTVYRCKACGYVVFSNVTNDQIYEALRKELNLLSPETIRSQREALGLTQKELADRLGVASETICRWETGALIQTRAMDNLLRLFFTLPEVRTALQTVAT
jgi:putative zinc finger/helix-turn-helix YgiT family protein